MYSNYVLLVNGFIKILHRTLPDKNSLKTTKFTSDGYFSTQTIKHMIISCSQLLFWETSMVVNSLILYNYLFITVPNKTNLYV